VRRVSEVDRLPVIKVWDQVLVPLQGEISDAVAERLFDQVLETIKESGAEGLIIDLTGIWMIDSHLCAVLSRLAAAARLMGAESIMCGMNAQIAITLQSMGIDMGQVRTALTLEEAFRSLGIGRVIPKKDDVLTRLRTSAARKDREKSRREKERDRNRDRRS
jgi:rsbT antagonist protein RsbS